MARLRHIALRTGDVAKTAAFYREAFDLEEVGKGLNGVYLSDGHINMAILKLGTPASPAGVDHFGFQVDDLEEAVERVARLGGGQITDLARIRPTDPSRPQSYFEVKVAGPERQEIDVSDTGWVGAPRDGSSGRAVSEDARQTAGRLFEELVAVMARLRGAGGCPWDREQTHASLRRYALEETCELLDAIDEDDATAIREELGDVLLQVLFHAQMAREEGRFAIEEVMAGLRDKLVRRHPHVFGDERAADAEAVLRNWERIKAREKASSAAQGSSLFTSVPRAMPALARAQRIGEKAAGAGFDWPGVEPVWRKVDEELDELKEAARAGKAERVEAELGDLLFSVVNLGRFLKVQAEEALDGAIARFHKRFACIERALAEQGRTVEQASFEEMDALWEEAKARS